MTIAMESLLENMKTNQLFIIDLRDRASYLKGHIPTAVSISSQDLIHHPETYLSFDKTYYLYCYGGHISNDISYRLTSLGYHAISVRGGYNYYLLCQ